ncbi:HlyD family type I secretion periplasmic adaptor subunit [Neorhizobium sp. NCHU2750]|uniref:HlyD family type I secretion periplasmic adaptor subunit n=1 Tax=Neorhizobium sp. NCHU2750 TaxID=1825976 RepID=UPI000E73A205|nr:HlyD family secretion protein [Neorhizobium sp. NCHU2750]
MEVRTSRQSLRHHAIAVTVLFIALFCGVGGWALATTISNAVESPATVIIDDNTKTIETLTGGIVSQLLVKEGSAVKQGDILVRLDATASRANLAILNATLAQLKIRKARLEAEVEGRSDFSDADVAPIVHEFDAKPSMIKSEVKLFASRKSSLSGQKQQLQEQQAQLDDQIKGDGLQIEAIDAATKLIDEEYQAINGLYEKQLVTMQRVNALKRQRVELDGERGEKIAARAQAKGRIAEISLKILQLDEDRRAENAKDLSDIEANIAETAERRVAVLDQLQKLDLRAPVDGRIYQLAIHTIGGVASPGDPLMLLAPQRRSLIVEAKVASRDIDQLRLAQPVEIRFSAFDQRTTPLVAGQVISISPDVVTDKTTGESYYPVRIRPDADHLDAAKQLALYPGMPADVFIKIADRSVISYFAKPLTDQMAHAFREK